MQADVDVCRRMGGSIDIDIRKYLLDSRAGGMVAHVPVVHVGIWSVYIRGTYRYVGIHTY